MTRGLPLAVWAGALAGGAVLAVPAGAAAVLAAEGGMDPSVVVALGTGTAAGLALAAVAVLAAARVAQGLRGLRRAAVLRLQDPTAPVDRPHDRPVVVRLGSEVAELAAVLEALHLRVRLGDQVGERHRRDAETAGAGVFELLSGLVAAEEGARGQLAAELHDTVAQSLMIARGLLLQGPLTPAAQTRLAEHVEDAEEQVRAVMARTRPAALRDGDLASAVDGLRLDLQVRYGLRVHLRWPQTAYPLPLATAVTVYRFFQEALLNVVKHADVDDAVAELEVGETTVRAVVRDEGPGFEPDEVRPDRGRHVGLGLLRERARLSGGSVTVRSGAAVGGTELVLELPRPVAPPAVPSRPAAPRPAAVAA